MCGRNQEQIGMDTIKKGTNLVDLPPLQMVLTGDEKNCDLVWHDSMHVMEVQAD